MEPILDDVNVLCGLEQQAHLEDVVGDCPWHMDVSSGRLQFGDTLEFQAEVLGTWAAASRTWLWAWANVASALPPAAVRQSEAARALGSRTGEEVFTAEEVEADEDDAFVIALAASGQLDAIKAIYRGPHDGGVVVLAITDPGFPPLPEPETARTLRIIVDAIQLGVLDDPTRGVMAWLQRRQFELSQGTNVVQAMHPNGACVGLRLDESGQVDAVTGTRVSPAAQER